MAVKKVLEIDGKYTGSTLGLTDPKGIKAGITLLCECNEEYKIHEKFNTLEGTVSRSTECSNCHDKTYLSYELTTERRSDGYTGDVKIKPKATAIRSKTLKQEEVDIEILCK
ncbi:MAG: hypothetical protein HZB68_03645 [Candidatus Aenigmarchaeota archaeon]|nr:hypothetical protein [Candidatus Aenigmarchaeota archaeon]